MRGCGRAAFDQAQGTSGHEGKRKQINAVVLEDRFERMRMSLANEPEITRWNLESRYVPDSVIARQMPFEHRKAAAVIVQRRSRHRRPLFPQPAGWMEHVEMREIGQRKGQTMQEIARLDQWRVERAAVEADERALRGRELGNLGEHCPFVLEAGQEKLPDAKAAVLENRAANQEGLCAGSAGESRGFDVEETQPRRITPARA